MIFRTMILSAQSVRNSDNLEKEKKKVGSLQSSYTPIQLLVILTPVVLSDYRDPHSLGVNLMNMYY